MGNKLIFSKELKSKLDSVEDTTITEWQKIRVTNVDEFMKLSIKKINECYAKFNLETYEFRDNIEVFGQSSTYFGVIENSYGKIISYVFFIPPKYETRSGVLAQQVFPVLSGIFPNISGSKSNLISNKPILIVDGNEVNHTPAMEVNVLCGKALHFMYVDLFNFNMASILLSSGIANTNLNNIKQLDAMLKATNNNNLNEFFEINESMHSVKFLKTRLKDGIHVNNEPYWFVLKAYAAAYLASKDKYKIDMSDINTLSRGNKTLDSFRDFITKIN